MKANSFVSIEQSMCRIATRDGSHTIGALPVAANLVFAVSFSARCGTRHGTAMASIAATTDRPTLHKPCSIETQCGREISRDRITAEGPSTT